VHLVKNKIQFNSSFHTFVSEYDFQLINNTGVWPTAPYYRWLNPDQV
jgi:hypothetical protein